VPFVASHYNVKLALSLKESAKCLVDELFVDGTLVFSAALTDAEQTKSASARDSLINNLLALPPKSRQAGSLVGVVTRSRHWIRCVIMSE
jgi:hypothetical protein